MRERVFMPSCLQPQAARIKAGTAPGVWRPRKSVPWLRISAMVDREEGGMKNIVRLALFPIVTGLLWAGCLAPPAVMERKEPATAKERLDKAFSACEEAPQVYFAACDALGAADKARLAALDETNASPVVSKALHAKQRKAVADEDRAFANAKWALDKWSAAIARVKAATEDYRKVEGEEAGLVAGAAMRAVESQEVEHRKNAAQYEQGLQGWEQQRRPKP